MKVNQIAELTSRIKSGEQETLYLDDTFTFSCKTCGQCCANQIIMLSTYDIIRMRKALEMDTSEMIKSGLLSFQLGANSKAPLALLKFREIPDEDITLCPFLTPTKDVSSPEALVELMQSGKFNPDKIPNATNDYGDNIVGCGIHQHRPLRCRLYPLGRLVTIDKDTEEKTEDYILQGLLPFCNGEKDASEITVRAWLEKQELEPYLKRSLRCIDIATRIGQSSFVEGKLSTELAFRILYDFDKPVKMFLDAEPSPDDILDLIEGIVDALLVIDSKIDEAVESPDTEELEGVIVKTLTDAVGKEISVGDILKTAFRESAP